MGLGSLKDAPDVPDPKEIAAAQTGTNIGTTMLNRAMGNTSTVTPYGKTDFVERSKKHDFVYKDPYTGEKYRVPTFKEKVKLKPGEKEQFGLQQDTETNLLGLANDLSGSLGDTLGKPFSLGGFGFGDQLYNLGDENLTLGNDATEARLFELGSKRLDPKFAAGRENLQSSLLSRGIREGTDAWDAATRNFNEGENDAYNNLLLTGRAQASAETQAEWAAKLDQQARAFQQGMAMRSQPINEISALLGGGQVTVPQLTGTAQPQAPITDTAGIINNNWEQQFKAWQAESQATQGMLGGLFGMAGNIFASDARIKEKGEVVGQTPDGLDIYEFRIGDGAIQTGVMAQDVEKKNPEAIVETPSGVKAVDYGQVQTDGAYTVQRGDNLTKIGARFGVAVPDIVAANGIRNPDLINPGQVLQIPGMAAPGPDAIPYDPLSSAFLPPENGSGGVDAVAAALNGAPVGDMSAAMGGPALPPPRVGDMSATMGNLPPPPPPPAPPPPITESDVATLGKAMEMGNDRQWFAKPSNIGDLRPQSSPPLMPGGGSAAYGETPSTMLPPPPAASAPPPPVGTVGAGSTGGEFFTPPPPRGAPAVDPNLQRFTDTFDQPSPSVIMDLLAAWERQTPFIGMAQQPAFAPGGF